MGDDLGPIDWHAFTPSAWDDECGYVDGDGVRCGWPERDHLISTRPGYVPDEEYLRALRGDV
jgi:hypothetical protein